MPLDHYVTLGRSGLRVSPMCLGTMTFGDDWGWGSSVQESEAILDRFLDANAEAGALRDRHFVWVKVNWSKENKNEAFLARYPAIKGYPHLFVLDADGKLLHSQDTGDLESGKSYDLAKMKYPV